MRLAVIAAACLAAAAPAFADPLELVLDQATRGYRNTGTVTLRAPVTGEVLGTYQFGTGGMGRGSAPFGRYEIGAFRGLDDDRRGIGERFMLHEPGRGDGEVWDPQVATQRTFIELHRCHYAPAATGGCLCVVADLATWRGFIAKINFLIAWHETISFELRGNPSATTNSHQELSDVAAGAKPRNIARSGKRGTSGAAQGFRWNHRRSVTPGAYQRPRSVGARWRSRRGHRA